MGLVFSSLWSSLFGSKQRKVVIVGLDNAGKTSILYRLNLGAGGGEQAAEQARPEGDAQGEAAKPVPIQTVPTIGANVERLRIASVEMECWDLGGQSSIRTTWASYFQNMDALVLVVDACDRLRIGLVKEELFALLQHEKLRESGLLLILANKQDAEGAMPPEVISEELQLHRIEKTEWHIQGSSAVTGVGLREGFEWLAGKVRANDGRGARAT